jgi:2-polyprenyl-3-methyl-5-hydroxy-6-metoxy-1,4-benzoquinol methylase
MYRRYFRTISMVSYKNILLNEETEFYDNEIKKIVSNGKKYSISLANDFESFSSREKLKDYSIQISLLDPLGMVLIKEVGGKKIIYRGIFPNKTEAFKELYQCGVLQALAEAGRVVKMKPTNFYTKEYPLIIEMETLCAVPANCWSFSMVRECAINMIIINKVLREFGYSLLDGHIGNTAFKNNNPIFFDLGSFIKGRKDIFKEEYISRCLNTLLMMSIKNSYFSRRNISSSVEILPPVININDSIEMQTLRNIYFKYHARHSSREYNLILKKVFLNKIIQPEYISILFKERPYEKSLWGMYSNPLFEQNEPDKRRSRILELIHQYSPDARTCLDIAGNQGYVGSLLETMNQFDSIISVDYDENAIELGREHLKGKNVNLYLLNPFLPMTVPPVNYESIIQHIKSDVVLALAVTHHLILTQKYNIHAIFSVISLYTKKYVYIEFCPLGLYGGGDALPEVPSWYTDEWFEENFKSQFTILHREVIDTAKIVSEEKNYRIIYIGKKIHK